MSGGTVTVQSSGHAIIPSEVEGSHYKAKKDAEITSDVVKQVHGKELEKTKHLSFEEED